MKHESLTSLRGMARDGKIERCQWCGNYTRVPCQCPAEVEIDRLRAALAEVSSVDGSHTAEQGGRPIALRHVGQPDQEGEKRSASPRDGRP